MCFYQDAQLEGSPCPPCARNTDPTPLGDYAKGTALVVSLTPPSGKAINGMLASAPTFLGGLPFAAATLSGTPPGLGVWTLTAQSADVKNIAVSLQNAGTGGTYSHLNPEAIDDIVMVCHYSAK